jgi:hypothetical protein
VLESNNAEGESRYMRAKSIVYAVLNDLEAGKTFFRPAALATFLRHINNDREWQGRVEMTPDGLRVDKEIFRVPNDIPGRLEVLDATIAEIKTILNRPLSEFKLAA